MAVETGIGSTAAEVVVEIARRNPQIKTLKFARYFPGKMDEVDLFWHFDRGEVLEGNALATLLSPGYNLDNSQIGLISLVETVSDLRQISPDLSQIPILFLSSDLLSQQARIERIMEFLRGPLEQQQGWVLSTHPDNYYFCSPQVLRFHQWMDFVTEARKKYIDGVSMPEHYMRLALTPKITRETGIGHPYATLRISTNTHVPTKPRVVAIL